MIEAVFIDIQQVQCAVGNHLTDLALGPHFGKVTHPAQQTIGNARRTASATGNLERAQCLNRQAENAGRATNDGRQVVDVIKLQTLDDAKTVAQRIGQHAGARGGANQGKRRQIQLDRACGRAFADHDVELEVLHGWIKDFLDNRRQAMDFIDKQHITRL